MNKNFLPYDESLELKDLGFDDDTICVHNSFKQLKGTIISSNDGDYIKNDKWDNRVLAPTFQDAFEWFETNYQMYVDKNVDTNVNEILDITYKIKSWRFPPITIIFDNPHDCFDNDKARLTCIQKLIELAKNLNK